MPKLNGVVLGAMLGVLGCTGQRAATFLPVDMAVPVTDGGERVAPVPSTLRAQLAAAGLDLDHLPDLPDLDDAQRLAVMALFTAATGASCADCHAEDRRADTPKKRVARRMWSEIVRTFTLSDGQPLFCDSCHQGKLDFLDRRDGAALAAWMKRSFVDGLRRQDGAAHDCASCHGTPFVGGFLDGWGADDLGGGGTLPGSPDAPAWPGSPADLGVSSGDLAPALDLSAPGDVSDCQPVLNELQVAGLGGAADEFIELFNPCSTDRPLAGYKLVYRSALGSSDVLLVGFGGGKIAAGGYLVAANAAFLGSAAVHYTPGLASGGGAVGLRDGAGAIVDTIAYGNARGAFVVGSAALAPPSGRSLARTPNGSHAHGDQSLDLVVATPTPGAVN